MWCDKNSDVVSWSSEETVISYVYDVDKKPHRYFPDLKVQLKDGRTLLIEIKPAKETEAPKYPGRRTKRYLEESLTYVKNQNKWEAARKYCKQRGWEFQVWTEHTLQEMRIMRAPLGKKAMKPLPKMAGFKKKKG